MIQAEGLNKKFKVYKKGEGITGYLKSFIHRDYEEIHAVADLDLEIEKGEIVGYIGANGAGKSTTVKMLTGILEPTSGKVTVNGRDPHKNRIKNAMNIGVVFGQKTQLWWDLPVKESFKLLKEIYEVPDEKYEDRIQRFTEVLDLEEFMEKPVRKLSLGQKMRCELAAAFLHMPPVVYLDEPTIGLDVSVKEKIREFIKEINQEKDIAVMVTSHDLGDIEDLCERIIVLDEGKKIFDGSIEELMSRFSERRIVLDVKGTQEVIQLNNPGIIDIELQDGQVEVVFDKERTNAAELISEILGKYDVADFQIKEPDIKEVVKRIYKEGIEG
ncbi:MAG: ATP-binding cassette domain-containing protein [Candidatus Nanohaloarchaeota archaeon QJJ-9]|nr:ATP-binding cassette domain-containing protein [Candidatus Nanohaloarchaeota archaeon QJJ-9]